MKANPGGNLNPDEIIGRDDFIEYLWTVLDVHGFVLSGERRTGKSVTIKKMHAYPADGFLTFYQDLAKVNRVVDLVSSLFFMVEDHLSRLKKVTGRGYLAWQSLPKKFAKVDISSAPCRWREFLNDIVVGLLDAAGPEIKIVLLWDEFTVMLDKVYRNEGEVVVMDLLDQLRTLRQEYPNLRMVFTGSIGLHLILRRLALAGNPNRPVNDMHSEGIEPLTEAATVELAEKLLSEISPPSPETTALAQHMAQSTEGFAFHVQHVAARLQRKQYPLTLAGVTAALDHFIDDAFDPLDLKNYIERLERHYEPEEKKLARTLLNILSTEDHPLSMQQLINLLRYQEPMVDVEKVRDVVDLLRQDHYLIRTVSRSYQFRWRLVKKWWESRQ